jgi:hypothetical protein
MKKDKSSEDQMKCKEGCHIVKRRILYSSNHVQSDNEDILGASESYFLLPLHNSTILYLLMLDTLTSCFNSHDHWLER